MSIVCTSTITHYILTLGKGRPATILAEKLSEVTASRAELQLKYLKDKVNRSHQLAGENCTIDD
jgi:hypothetical protein